jgi:drug/metabolite transporter (DMT)-like permease
MSTILVIGLSMGSAFFFIAASWAMKVLGAAPLLYSLPLVFLLLGLGGWLEIEVLKATRLGYVMVLMLCAVLGERYTYREIAGVAVILGGMILLSTGKPSAQDDAAIVKASPQMQSIEGV